MSRGAVALLVLLGAVGWFAVGAPRASSALRDARARSLQSIQPFHLVAAAAQPGAALPSGEEAARAAALLETLLVLQIRQERWARQAVASLSDEQLAFAKANARAGAPTPRSRAHRYLPAELVRMEAALAARFGSAPGEARPPDLTRWRDGSPVDLRWGLLALIEAEDSALTPQQGGAIQAALLDGLMAYQSLPEVQEALEVALGPTVVSQALALSTGQLHADRVMASAAGVIRALKARAGSAAMDGTPGE